MNDPTLLILAGGRARRYGGVKQLAPVGIHGEAVIDLIGSDAFAAGFNHVVVVVNDETGPQIREHIETHWPTDRRVSFAIQQRPLGTVHAVLSAADVVDRTVPFAVANADDLYGRDAMLTLGTHLREVGTNCLVGFRLDRALVGDRPVTRGVCKVHDGILVAITERRHVKHTPTGYISDDGLQPRSLDPAMRVSMNLWGFDRSTWFVFERAMKDAGDVSEDTEVLLPVIVGQLVRQGETTFRVLEANSRCIGVTHPDDLTIVQADVRDQVARGDRPAEIFSR